MYTPTSRSIRLSSIALAIIVISGTAEADSLSENVTEARQETQIWTTYALSPYLRASDINVSVHDGKATLTGKVDEDVNKDLAKQIAIGVVGIKEVDNQIEVQSGYMPLALSSARSYGQMIDDTTISTAIKSKLIWSKYTDGLTATVDTKSGRVTMYGTASSEKAKKIAGRLAMNTQGVVSVDNQLVVNKSTLVATKQDISDSWITTKVKSTLLYSRNIDASDIAVSTSSGVVTLKGKMDSGVERALAIELTQNVRGVKSVHSKGLVI